MPNMSQSSASKAGSELVPVRGEHGRLAPGTPSLNPAGRPKRGQTLAEQWRRETNWPKLRARLEGIVYDEKAKHADVVAAARELLDRSWGRPLTTHDLTITTSNDTEQRYDVGALSTEEARRLLDIVERAELPDVETAALPDQTGG
jgi:hypothetical protein